MNAPDTATSHLGPLQPDARLERVFTEYREWAKLASIEYEDRIADILGTIDAVGEDPFYDYFKEAIAEFSGMLTTRAIPQYGHYWIRAYHGVDTWVFENIRKAGRRDEILAIVAKNGIDRVESVVNSLAEAYRAKRQTSVPSL